MLYKISESHNVSTAFLPDYTEGRVTKAIKHLLKEHGAKFGAVNANKILFEIGILEKQERESTKVAGEMREFWSLTQAGLEFGKNLVNHNNPRQTQPHYYVDKFPELLDRINAHLHQCHIVPDSA